MNELANVIFTSPENINALFIAEFLCAIVCIEFIGILLDAFKVGK